MVRLCPQRSDCAENHRMIGTSSTATTSTIAMSEARERPSELVPYWMEYVAAM